MAEKKTAASESEKAPEDLDLPPAVEAPAEEERLHPILTNAEYRAAQETAAKKLAAERKKAAIKAVEEEALAALKREEGLATGDDAKDEIVSVTIDLAEHSRGIIVNFTPYWHGHTYEVPRHVADTLNEIMYRGWSHQFEIDGKTRTQFYQSRRDTVVSAVHGVKNAPQKAA